MTRLSPTLEDCDIIGRQLIRVVRDWRRSMPARYVRYGGEHRSTFAHALDDGAAMIDVVRRAAEDYMEFGPAPSAVGFHFATFDPAHAVREFRRSMP